MPRPNRKFKFTPGNAIFDAAGLVDERGRRKRNRGGGGGLRLRVGPEDQTYIMEASWAPCPIVLRN